MIFRVARKSVETWDYRPPWTVKILTAGKPDPPRRVNKPAALNPQARRATHMFAAPARANRREDTIASPGMPRPSSRLWAIAGWSRLRVGRATFAGFCHQAAGTVGKIRSRRLSF
jgi:hypothetical protein